MTFKKVTIIGAGLIGSSIARAIKEAEHDTHLTISDMSENVCEQADELRLADDITSDVALAVKGADLVMIAIPVGAFKKLLPQIKDHLKPGCIVSDVGSVKQNVYDEMKNILPETVSLIPGHPIAGTENSGPASGFATLFERRWVILTPVEGRYEEDALARLKTWWESFGARIGVMSAQHHDHVLAVTSHLPHLVAFSIMNTAFDLEEETKQEIIQYSAGGFRDFTRVAGSDPIMWRDIFLQNKEPVLNLLQRFTEDLTILQKHIRRGDGEALQAYFQKARDLRKNLKTDH